MKNQLALTAVILLIFLNLAAACSISPNPASGTVGNSVSLQVVRSGSERWPDVAESCGEGGTASAVNGDSFTCTYSSTGTKTINVHVDDGFGGTSSCSSTVTISSPSNPAPSISFTQPSGSTVSQGSTVTLGGTASDDGSVASVSLSFSCGGSATASGTTSWSYSWVVPNTGRDCTITATATDNSGQTASTSRSFNLQAGVGGCIERCSNRQKTTCPSGGITNVQCCTASDCSDTCSGNQYRAPTCSATNTCTYASPVLVEGQCGYNPNGGAAQPEQAGQKSCSLALSRSDAPIGSGVGVTVSYQNFAPTPPGSVAVRCGNGQSATASNCNGANGSCTTQCTYGEAGTFVLTGGIQGTACNSATLVILRPDEVQTAGGTAQCNLTIPSETRVNLQTSIGINYANLPTAPGNVIVQCGNGGTSQTQCFGSSGNCAAQCIYSQQGRYTPSVTLSGVSCTANQLSVLPPQSRQFFAQEEQANISITQLATQPAVIIENTPTQLSAVLQSDEAITSAQCTAPANSPSTCSCRLTSSATSNLLDCSITPPVNGKYSLTLTSASGKTRQAEITLTPGAAAEVNVVEKGFDYTFYAAAAVALLLIGYALYYGATKVEEKLTAKERLLKRRGEIMREIDLIKVRYMKGDILQNQFRDQYNAKQKELTDVNAKIGEMEKKETAK